MYRPRPWVCLCGRTYEHPSFSSPKELPDVDLCWCAACGRLLHRQYSGWKVSEGHWDPEILAQVDRLREELGRSVAGEDDPVPVDHRLSHLAPAAISGALALAEEPPDG